MREETCDYCEKPLADLNLRHEATRPTPTVTADLRVHGKRWALDFDRVPPFDIRAALKSTGWRWDPRYRVWWSTAVTPLVPPGVKLPPDHSPTTRVAAKPPIIRRHAATT